MTTSTSITLRNPLDMHLHFRDGAMLQTVAPLSAALFAGGVIMPNLVPPVDTLAHLLAYRETILQATSGSGFEPYMTLFFRQYSEAELIAAKPYMLGVKLYPAGVTTNSAGGVQNFEDAQATLALMEQIGIPLMVHGESHGFVLDREVEFLDVYDQLARRFPKLKIVMEHITTRQSVEFLDKYPNVFATVTLHHLMITLDDVAGGHLQPHLFCKPIAKRPEDRDALLQAALRAHPKLMYGSDSAPHPQHAKEAAGCAAGVFTAPVSLSLLVELFEQHQALDQLQAFVSDTACRVYQISPPAKMVQLAEQPWAVPERYDNVVPFYAGRTLRWRVVV